MPDEGHYCIADSRFEALEAWQARQNGSLQRIEGKVDKLLYACIGAALSCIAAFGVLAVNLTRGCL